MMQRYNTLNSLNGLRMDVTLLDTVMYDAQLCAQQYTYNAVERCLRAENISVYARMVSLLYQGIDIALVPLNDASWGA